MPFSLNDQVQHVSDSARIGVVLALGPVHAGQRYYKIFWGGVFGTSTVAEADIRLYVPVAGPAEAFAAGLLAGYYDFQRLITLQRLLREEPLRNNIYAFNASRTQFYPYQFKPLLKFIDSPRNRLLICDEVGLGKTIEAGLIMLELRARQTVRLVLVVCPSNLRQKWRLELRQRFGEDFRVLDTATFSAFLDDYEEGPERVSLNGVASIETIRQPRIRSRLEELAIPFDLVIIDEAHHLRNFGTSQRRAGLAVTQAAQAAVMLSATPVQLGLENLFSLLNILDEEDFPDKDSALRRFTENEHVVNAQRALARLQPSWHEAAVSLALARRSAWLGSNPAVAPVQARLEAIAAGKDAVPSRREHLDLQRDVAEFNLLGHIVTRTRKRDVQEHVAARRARAVTVEFTPDERRFYDLVTRLIQQQSLARGDSPVVAKWRLNTPQRRLSSCLPGMVRFYRERGLPSFADDETADMGTVFEDEEAETGSHSEADLASLIAAWPDNAIDSKYEALRTLLRDLQSEENTRKVIIFATFKHTLRYLADRLQADQLGVSVITGDTPPEDRMQAISRFRDDRAVRVLLSSRVGSEGLDFQFCSTVVNYDLPWNPMEVEQRIGRVDRIGQASASILILNFWIAGTIEERILRRLYDRVKIFERSIGDLEPILGDLAQEIQAALLDPSLTPAEVEERVERLARVIEERRRSEQQLEEQASNLVGVDDFFDEQVQSIRRKRRYVTGEQLHRFLADFLRREAPNARLICDTDSKLGQLVPDRALAEFLRRGGRGHEAALLIGSVGQPIAITFDAPTAFQHPRVDFLNVLHPLVGAVADHFGQMTDLPTAFHVALRTGALPIGLYPFAVFKVRVSAARSYTSLEAVFLREDLSEACDADGAEVLLGEMVELGQAASTEVELSRAFAVAASSKAEALLLGRLAQLRLTEQSTNNAFVDQRLASVQSFYGKLIQQHQRLLDDAIRSQRQERYVRMQRGMLGRRQAELDAKRRDLDARRAIGVEHDWLAAGILEICPP